MNGVFDLGGTDGLGPVNPPAEEPVFSNPWEKAAFAMFPACFRAGFFGLDEFRHAIELLDPVEYLKSPYYEHWLHAVEHHGVVKGHIDADELERRTRYYLENPEAPLPEHEPKPELIEFVNAVVPAGAPAQRPTDEPVRFQVGDTVRIASASPFGHTRMARYIRGKTATVVAYRGSFIFPDSAANGGGEDPQHVYTVQFDAAELWGEQYAEPNTSTTFDAWDPYLEPVKQTEGAFA